MVAICAAVVAFPILPDGASASDRELGSHQHGRGTLNIAIEGSVVWVELEAPGADIVGFEHPARSAEDKAAVAAAKARLADFPALFTPTPGADCRLEQASVVLEGVDDHEGQAKAEAEPEADDHDAHEHEETEAASHSAFHAEYKLTCADIAALEAMSVQYFGQFPGAEALEVTVIDEQGQRRQTVDRIRARISLR